MCGISGAVAFNKRDVISQSVLQGMCQILRHRGPDDEGYYLDDHAMLGARRLSIIDLETGGQPVTNEDRSVWLVFNGEIYNYRQIRAQLETRGHTFASQGDTEVIIHAYEEYGDGFLEHFNGMFAFALWDKRQQRLFLARDRLGIKPLYYWAHRDQIVFGSELKAIIAHPLVPRQIDPVALDHFLTLEYIPAPRTLFQGVKKLKPGYCLTFHRGGLALHQYWDIPSLEVPQDENACQEILASLISDAVTMQLVSDVPLGAFLSGGIDSSTVVAHMSQASNSPIQTFSIGFEEKSYNELPYARDIANGFNTIHREQVMVPEIASLAEQLIGHLDEPLADFSIFPTYLVSQLASQSVKVVLSGDGGDEIFGGYDTYVAQQLDGYYQRLPSVLRQKALPALIDLIPPRPVKKGLINKTKRFLEGSVLHRSLMHTRWMIFLNQEDKENLYQREWRNTLDGHSTTSLLEDYFYQARHFDPLAQQQYVDVKTYLADDILTKVDRMSMAASVEARVPLLDHRIVEFALNLPQSMKIHRGRTKIILREIMKDRLPKSVLSKPKEGFSIPMKNWLSGPLKPLVTDLLSESCIKQRGYFNPQTISRWVQEHLDGRANHSHRLWALMAFELWQEKILPVQV